MPHVPLDFRPLFGIPSGYFQTFLGIFGLPLKSPPYREWIVPTSEGDALLCLVSTPSDWSPTLPTVVLVHGLGGSADSRYMIRFSRHLYRSGIRVVRVNLRGSGAGAPLARLPANAGRSEDVLAICQALKSAFPDSPIRLVGVSLAGNIILKLLGEAGSSANDLIERAIAISPSVDLHRGIIEITKPKNRLIDQFYVKALLEILKEREQLFPDEPKPQFPKKLNLYDFDDIFTAPVSGYQNADEYYAKCSSNQFVKNISVPTWILYAKDDPVTPAECVEALALPENVTAYETKHGGHVAFLGWAGFPYGFRWMDRFVIEFLLRKTP